MAGHQRAQALVALVVSFLILSGCGPQPGEDEAVRAVFNEVQAGQFDQVESRLTARNRTPQTRAAMEQLQRDYIPSATPDETQRLHWSFVQGTEGRTITAVDQYTYPDRILIVTTTLQRSADGPYQIDAFHINLFDPAEVGTNEFRLTDKPPRQIAFFVALIASVLLMLMALLGAIFTRPFKRKWRWAIVSLLGAPVFVMNWATGVWNPEFAFGLINAGVTRGLSPLDPWFVRFHLPIGALVTLSLLLPHWMGRAPKDESA